MGEFRKFRLSVMGAMCLAALGARRTRVRVRGGTDAEDRCPAEGTGGLKAQVQKVQADTKAQAAATASAKPAAGAPVQQAEVDSWRKYFAAVPKGEAPATSARTGVTVYGRFDLGYESNDDGAVRRKVLNSYSSRIGFKGTRVLSEDLTGVMQIETGVAPDDNANAGTWGSRETYAGLRSKSFGTIKLGKHDSPFKDLEGEAAPMWGQGEAMEVIIHGKGTAVAAGSTWANFHTRYTNVAQYETPKFADFQVKAAYSTDEVNGATGTVRKPSWATSAAWDTGDYFLGMAYQSYDNFNGQGKSLTGVKAAGSAVFGDFTGGLMWSRLDNDIGKKTDNWLISGTYKMGQATFKGLTPSRARRRATRPTASRCGASKQTTRSTSTPPSTRSTRVSRTKRTPVAGSRQARTPIRPWPATTRASSRSPFATTSDTAGIPG